MKTRALRLCAILLMGLVGCKGRHVAATENQAPSLSKTADDFRDDLIQFSKDAAGLPQATDTPSVVPATPPVAARPRHLAKTTKKVISKAPVTGLAPDTAWMTRPFTEAEIARFVAEHFRAATAELLTEDPHFDATVEEAQFYSRDGVFAFLKARRAMARGRMEEALVQTELAIKRGSTLDPDTRKHASRLRCEALDAIRKAHPSQEAVTAAARAWQAHNLLYSSN
jgi:hypothetical protein